MLEILLNNYESIPGLIHSLVGFPAQNRYTGHIAPEITVYVHLVKNNNHNLIKHPLVCEDTFERMNLTFTDVLQMEHMLG